jgi:hypothetical protein
LGFEWCVPDIGTGETGPADLFQASGKTIGESKSRYLATRL